MHRLIPAFITVHKRTPQDNILIGAHGFIGNLAAPSLDDLDCDLLLIADFSCAVHVPNGASPRHTNRATGNPMYASVRGDRCKVSMGVCELVHVQWHALVIRLSTQQTTYGHCGSFQSV